MTRPNDPRADGSAAQPTAAPIVLIAPAMAIGSRFYTPLVAAFAERGWNARALPRRGFEQGELPAARGHDWSYRDEIDVIDRAVAAARAEAPDRPVVVLGHSLGAQLAAGLELTSSGADGLVTIGGCLPYYRHYRRGGLDIAVMATLVPLLTAVAGYLPAPAFGAPGARTMMREWARMVLTGRTPFPARGTIDTAALVISLEGDTLGPRRGIDAFARDLFAPDRVTRWDYRSADVPAGASNDHIRWVRSPGPVVDRVVAWWQEASATSSVRVHAAD
ncbi:serine aminopeptidase domain-containing protein [Nocardia sp. NPDC058379]|uniref:serine aminopeptidase domain-containing protein n=1 Tax=unclassified Nocardia TaxID=2637762 RepID=UPI00365AF090